MSSALFTLLAIALAVILGIALAYLPMRILVGTIARNVRAFIQRQRDRRNMTRETPDRRKAEEDAAAATASVPSPSPQATPDRPR